jgi:hypothetical protein
MPLIAFNLYCPKILHWSQKYASEWPSMHAISQTLCVGFVLIYMSMLMPEKLRPSGDTIDI